MLEMMISLSAADANALNRAAKRLGVASSRVVVERIIQEWARGEIQTWASTQVNFEK